jgi:sugar lactone lactonase YvrE
MSDSLTAWILDINGGQKPNPTCLRRLSESSLYNSRGQQIGVIEVPERPLQLVFGGLNKPTLFALAHHTLYAISMPGPKR